MLSLVSQLCRWALINCFIGLSSPSVADKWRTALGIDAQGADYGYGYSDSPRANDRHGGGEGEYGGAWGSAPSHGVDDYG